MDEAKERRYEALLMGLMASQQVVLDALIRDSAIGYHQVREALENAVVQLEAAEPEVDPICLLPFTKLLASINALHAPHPPGAETRSPDWVRVVREGFGAR